jgi:nucleotide-binding universal stress UspA family protein
MTVIVIATDGSLSAERAVHIGADIAKARRADVVLVSAIDTAPIPDSLRAMAETEHVIDATPEVHDAHRANIPSWMMQGVLAAARAQETINLRRAVSDLALEKARAILGEAGVTQITDRVAEGAAADVIVQAAEAEHAEMVVMGSRGLGALETFLHGSTSKSVAERTDRTCVVVT